MRATINFDIESGRVAEIMRCLVLEEADMLHTAIAQLESAVAETLRDDIDAATGHLEGSLRQLRQYKGMLIGFERAKLDSHHPTPVAPSESPLGHDELRHKLEETKATMQNMGSFKDILSQLTDMKHEPVDLVMPTTAPKKEPNDDSEEG